MTRILITGGCGFIGHHFVQGVYKTTDWDIIIVDKLSYASKGFQRIRDLGYYNDPRVLLITHDLMLPLSEGLVRELGNINYIVHFAAETHVDNSISEPVFTIGNNVMSTVQILEYARTLKSLKLFVNFSTDEVYGPAPDNIAYKEEDAHHPTNPYSGSKSASESICLAYENTYKVPIIITNVMNVMGERQHVEKYIPKVIKSLLDGEEVIIHCDKTLRKPGSRFYIHARNVTSAVMFLIDNHTIGERYNIVGEEEIDNLKLAQFISSIVGKTLRYKLVDFHSNRPGHDLRYALDGTKLHNMGWICPIGFTESLRKTILWTLEHREWLIS